MGVVWKTVLFLLRRGPDIYATGRVLTRSLSASPALVGEGETRENGGGTRIEAVERELRALGEARERLAGDVERLGKEVEVLRAEVARARSMARLMIALFSLFVLGGLLLGVAVLSRFP
ncbi:MAG TPA: hypothetical protein VIU29_09290 [Candidatus Deferrimicrobiaceae bacterium]